ncbi:MAG: GAF domain-containing protein [Cytophagaceae bacterium]|nr:GAF domain-containing protein [Cytophagaceae bacterium]MDW8457054.1 GAF domain-containing protein [Cytophagaceae bacterium]
MLGYRLLPEEKIAALEKNEKLLRQQIKAAIRFINEVTEGNTNAQYEYDDENDELRKSLLKMQQSLNAYRAVELQNQWESVGLSKINDLLRIQYDSIQEFSVAVITELVRYLNANQAGLFVANEDEQGNVFLELTACYAYNRRKYLDKIIKPGQGLLGQVYLEKEYLYITDAPDKYVTITSGLGEATAKSLLIVPVKNNDIVSGVIEIASFNTFKPYEIDFVNKVGSSIAVVLASIKSATHTQKLLQAYKEQNENIRAQEEELRQNLEELQATQEKQREIEQELRKSKELIEQKLKEQDLQAEKMVEHMDKFRKVLIEVLNELPQKIFLKDSEGRFVLVNNAVAAAHHTTPSKLLGTSDFDHFPPEEAQSYRNAEIEIIKSGKKKIYEHEEKISGERKILRTMKMPFYIHHLDQMGLLGIQTDITELVELKNKINNPA